MYKVVRLQCAAALLGVLLATILFGARGAVSAAIGGAACVIPSLMFARRLSKTTGQPAVSVVGAFFFGEITKLGLAIGILVAAVVLFPGIHWGAWVLGMAVTLQANLLAFLLRT